MAEYGRPKYEGATAFPPTPIQPRSYVDAALDNAAVSGAGTVPANATFYVPQPLNYSGVSVTVDGSPRTLVPGNAPSAGQTAIDLHTGALTFDTADEGQPFVWSVAAPFRTVIMGDSLEYLENNISGAQAVAISASLGISGASGLSGTVAGILATLSGGLGFRTPGSTVAGGLVTYADSSGVSGGTAPLTVVAPDSNNFWLNPVGSGRLGSGGNHFHAVHARHVSGVAGGTLSNFGTWTGAPGTDSAGTLAALAITAGAGYGDGSGGVGGRLLLRGGDGGINSTDDVDRDGGSVQIAGGSVAFLFSGGSGGSVELIGGAGADRDGDVVLSSDRGNGVPGQVRVIGPSLVPDGRSGSAVATDLGSATKRWGSGWIDRLFAQSGDFSGRISGLSGSFLNLAARSGYFSGIDCPYLSLPQGTVSGSTPGMLIYGANGLVVGAGSGSGGPGGGLTVKGGDGGYGTVAGRNGGTLNLFGGNGGEAAGSIGGGVTLYTGYGYERDGDITLSANQGINVAGNILGYALKTQWSAVASEFDHPLYADSYRFFAASGLGIKQGGDANTMDVLVGNVPSYSFFGQTEFSPLNSGTNFGSDNVGSGAQRWQSGYFKNLDVLQGIKGPTIPNDSSNLTLSASQTGSTIFHRTDPERTVILPYDPPTGTNFRIFVQSLSAANIYVYTTSGQLFSDSATAIDGESGMYTNASGYVEVHYDAADAVWRIAGIRGMTA